MKFVSANLCEEDEHFFVNFRKNKITLNKNKEINDYLNRNTTIENVSCFNQIAKVFNYEKTFESFFESNVFKITKHKKFLELEYVFVVKLLHEPKIPKPQYVNSDAFVSKLWERNQFIGTIYDKENLIDAVNAWVNYNTEKRNKYEEVLMATINRHSWIKIGRGLKVDTSPIACIYHDRRDWSSW